MRAAAPRMDYATAAAASKFAAAVMDAADGDGWARGRDGVAEPNLVLFVVSCVCLFRSRTRMTFFHMVSHVKKKADLQQPHTHPLVKMKAKRLCFDIPQGA
jgi:hypothetical protein